MKDLLLKVKDYINNNYIEEIYFSHELPSCSRIIKRNNSIINLEDDFLDEEDSLEIRSSCSKRSSFDIKNKFFNVEETWQQALFKWIDDKELKDPDVYKRANISKQTFCMRSQLTRESLQSLSYLGIFKIFSNTYTKAFSNKVS